MKREDAEKIAADMAKAVFAFTAGRCASLEDAEDLSQEILLRAFRALLQRDDLGDPERFIWRVARNALANYYRGKARHAVGVPIDEIAETLPDPEDPYERQDPEEVFAVLRSRIAFLSKLRRRIVTAYYFEDRKTDEIAEELGIPAGTVRWHLFESRKEMKKGLETMRETEHLQFDPVRFTYCGTNGSVGSMGGCQNFFRSALSQNIAYAVYREAKTAGEIARDLGVSPVYVEDEAEHLEEYGFLTRTGDRYAANILINEPTEKECALREEMYERGAALIGEKMYDALLSSGITEETEHLWGAVPGELTMTDNLPRDRNLMLWSLIPYLASDSGEAIHGRERTVTFEEAATLRPDGGYNICEARIDPLGYPILPEGWNGPFRLGWNGFGIWQTDSPWSGPRITEDYGKATERDIGLLIGLAGGAELRPEEYAALCERGYLAVAQKDGCVKTGFRCVWIDGKEMNRRLLAIGDRVKADVWDGIAALKKPYVDTVMANTPERLRKMQAFGLGYLFHSDGAFLWRCMKYLLETGKMTLPEERLRQSISLVVIDEREG